MSFESDLYTRISTFAGLTALIGARSYHLAIPLNTPLPAVSYQCISQGVESCFGSDPGNEWQRVQFSVYSDAEDDIITIKTQLMACFQRWRGAQATVTIEGSFFDGAETGFDFDTKNYWLTLEFRIHYR